MPKKREKFRDIYIRSVTREDSRRFVDLLYDSALGYQSSGNKELLDCSPDLYDYFRRIPDPDFDLARSRRRPPRSLILGTRNSLESCCQQSRHILRSRLKLLLNTQYTSLAKLTIRPTCLTVPPAAPGKRVCTTSTSLHKVIAIIFNITWSMIVAV